jgi:hypothetical protein
MPSLLRDSSRRSSGGRTRRPSTVGGTGMRWRAPSILIHMHRALWMWAAIIRTVRRGLPGTLLDHNSGGRFSMRYTVTRWLVCHAAINASPSLISPGTFVVCVGASLTLNGNASAVAAHWCASRRRLQADVSRASVIAMQLTFNRGDAASARGAWRAAPAASAGPATRNARRVIVLSVGIIVLAQVWISSTPLLSQS